MTRQVGVIKHCDDKRLEGEISAWGNECCQWVVNLFDYLVLKHLTFLYHCTSFGSVTPTFRKIFIVLVFVILDGFLNIIISTMSAKLSYYSVKNVKTVF